MENQSKIKGILFIIPPTIIVWIVPLFFMSSQNQKLQSYIAMSESLNKEAGITIVMTYVLMMTFPILLMFTSFSSASNKQKTGAVMFIYTLVGLFVYTQYLALFPNTSNIATNDLKIKEGQYIYDNAMKSYQGIAENSAGSCCTISWFDPVSRGNFVNLKKISIRDRPGMSVKFRFRDSIDVVVEAVPKRFGRERETVQEEFWILAKPLTKDYLDSIAADAPVWKEKVQIGKVSTVSDVQALVQMHQSHLDIGIHEYLLKQIEKKKYPYAGFAQITLRLNSRSGY